MKHNLKNYLKLGILLFGISSTLVNCKQDDDFKSGEENSVEASNKKLLPNGMTLENISRSGIKSPKVLRIIDSIKQQKRVKVFTKNTLQKTITNDSLQISINDEYISYIESEDGSYHSYTFPAFDHEHPEGLKNLLISLQPDGSYKEMIVSYNLTEAELDLLNSGANIDLSDKVTYYPLQNNTFSSTIFSKVYYNADQCMSYSYVRPTCCSTKHDYDDVTTGGETCDCLGDTYPQDTYIMVLNLGGCPSSNGGGNNTDSGTPDNGDPADYTPPPPPPNGNNTPNGTTTGNNTNITTPTDCKGHDCPEEFQEKPCPGDPVLNPEIAPSGGWNVNGGRYGYTRNSGNSFHDGTDIKSEPGSNLYNILSGEVVELRDTFAIGQYQKRSYGNYVVIESTVGTDIVRLKYTHLRTISVEVGDSVNQSVIIGLTGETGNAQTRGGTTVIPHVHIKATKKINGTGDWVKTDPEDYISTNFDASGNPEPNDCN